MQFLQHSFRRIGTFARAQPAWNFSERALRGGRRHFSKWKAPKEEPIEPFEPDTPSSRLLYRATLVAVLGGSAAGSYYVWYTFYSEQGLKAAEEVVLSTPLLEGNPVVFMDFAVDGQDVGRVVFQLRRDICPKTAENFRQLCTMEKGFGYKGSRVHNVLPGNFVQAGDIVYGNGEGGVSIYGRFFEDENHKLKHIGPGTLSSASRNQNQNDSQFFINLKRAPIHDGRYVVFGNVMKGMEVLRTIERTGSTHGNSEQHDIRIVHCGELRLPEHMYQPISSAEDAL